MASCCVLCEIPTPNNMDYHKIAGFPPDPKYVSIDSDFRGQGENPVYYA